MAERVMIYATGSDSELRALGWHLLANKLADDVDRIDQGSLVVEDGKQRLRSNHVAILIATSREHVATIFERLRRIANTRAYVLPILEAL